MKTGRVLIIDDEEIVCAAMRELLELRGHTVFEANNGVEGLRFCAENEIDLIVLDLNMPRMDGYMFMEKLTERWEKEHRSFQLPKVLVMTAVDKKTDLGLAKNLGASKFMNKPFKSAEFTAAVNELISD
jgi:two-component system response regulator MprA